MKPFFRNLRGAQGGARKRSAAAWIAAREGRGLDRRAFDAWRQAHPDNGREYLHFNGLWEDPALVEALRRADRATTHAPIRLRRPRVLPLSLTAALALAILPLAWPSIELRFATPMEQKTDAGQRRSLVLEDGSRLDLAGDSWVRVRQTPHRRQVELLRGEAFFDVAHDAERPFLVLTADSRVQVIGTRFDVNLITDRTELSVEQGRVRFGPRDFLGPSRLIEAGHATAISAAGAEPLQPLQPGAAGDWREGWIETGGMSVSRLVEEMNRWSATPIRVADPALGAMTVAGRFRITSPERTLGNLARLHGFAVKREGAHLVLRRHQADSKAS